MYDLYVENCRKEKKDPISLSYYRNVFNTDFNIGFHKPKSDRCNHCEAYKVSKAQAEQITEEVEAAQKHHIAEKMFMRSDSNADRQNPVKFVVCFDLENVITLPKAEISSFFYKRKLTLYNLTAHTSTKRGYCAIWTESLSGRAGNDIASAAVKLMESIISDHPNLKELTTWSDSCVPQNRNSLISYAMAEFLSRQPVLEMITMKYAVPGHSCIQEVDNMHSIIENSMKVAEFYSPVSFTRLLLGSNRKNPFKVIQMQKRHFKDFMSCAKILHYNRVPFSSVTSLQFEKSKPDIVRYKTLHQVMEYSESNITNTRNSRNKEIQILPSKHIMKFVIPRVQRNEKKLDPKKENDLRGMMKFMPLQDKQYYETIMH